MFCFIQKKPVRLKQTRMRRLERLSVPKSKGLLMYFKSSLSHAHEGKPTIAKLLRHRPTFRFEQHARISVCLLVGFPPSSWLGLSMEDPTPPKPTPRESVLGRLRTRRIQGPLDTSKWSLWLHLKSSNRFLESPFRPLEKELAHLTP